MEDAPVNLVPILHYMSAWTLVMLRFLGLMFAIPLLSAGMMPARVRGMLAAMFAVAAFGLIPPQAREVPSLDLLELVPLMLGEVGIGYVIGLAAFLPFLAIEIGGYLIGYQMGFSLAQAFNPAIETNLNSIGSMIFYLAVAAFVFLGGFDRIFGAVLLTYDTIPIGLYRPGTTALDLIVALVSSATETGVRLSGPAFGSAMVVLVAIGFVMKTMPQLNVMSVGFALKIIVGIAMVAVSIFVLSEVIDEEVLRAVNAIEAWASSPDPNAWGDANPLLNGQEGADGR
ncbi:MAG: flagellar biosynthetic protein FliR [Planctomycetota bacterium]